MNTKQIRISERAYNVLEARKSKHGVSICRQVDDLIFKGGSGTSLMEIMAALDGATKARLDKCKEENIK